MFHLKKLLFGKLSFEQYLRLLQRGYLFAYRTGLLKFSPEYNYHYNVKKLINKGDTVIDIGANLGYYSFLFARWVGKTGNVYSVEPIKDFNRIFNEVARKYKQLTLYPYALGNKEKTIRMVSSPHAGYFRTGLPHVYDAKKDGALENAEFTFEAEMKIPSKLFSSLDRIDYIKCDVEGFEFSILSDMRDIIAKHKPAVQVEVWKENTANILSLFHNLGYKAYKFDRNKLVSTDLSKIGGDYIFLYQEKLS
ncbi:MAG: FkbM family methyltransferase [Prevotellaceae bacterium]|jgi:FkbM family methyltransferase|nr:FkbM family methyltransferase [Prevotellaceae bacterium]